MHAPHRVRIENSVTFRAAHDDSAISSARRQTNFAIGVRALLATIYYIVIMNARGRLQCRCGIDVWADVASTQ